MSNGAGQLQTGNLYGTVTDSEGEALPGVTLTLSGVEHPRIQISNAEGQFRFMGLEPGTYKLTAELDGFNTVEHPDIKISAGHDTTIKIEMTLANVEE